MIVGVDEAGRGAWAGNVVAAAVVLPDEYNLPYLTDSKKLSPKRREQLYDAIMAQAICVRIGQQTPAEIDTQNIHHATLTAMRLAILAVDCPIDEVQIDGAFVPPDLPYPARAIVGGDGSEPVISAASIIAKVTRDRQLLALHAQYPHYQFAAHKGYGTKAHQQALTTYGVLSIHRKSYAPIKKLLSLP